MLRYSSGALAVRPRFFAAYNDITIIVEDTEGENLYTQIMKRILGDAVIVGRVLGMGGKAQVIQRYESRRSIPAPPSEFYLVDGDFDELIGRACPSDQSFYKLNRYDIESFLLEETAICVLAEEERPSKNAEQHREELQFRAWELQVVDIWHRMAACAAVLQDIEEPHSRLCSTERYVSGYYSVPEASRVESAIDSIARNQSVMNPEQFRILLAEMDARIGPSHDDRVRWISGKKVWIPLAIRLLRRHTGKSFRKESLCFRLAKNCEFRELDELREQILSIVGGAGAGTHSSQAAKE